MNVIQIKRVWDPNFWARLQAGGKPSNICFPYEKVVLILFEALPKPFQSSKDVAKRLLRVCLLIRFWKKGLDLVLALGSE